MIDAFAFADTWIENEQETGEPTVLLHFVDFWELGRHYLDARSMSLMEAECALRS